MAVCVDLNKPLASKVRINGILQMVEYDALPNVCFTYGLYGHSSSLYLERQATRVKTDASKNMAKGGEKGRWKGSLEIKIGGVNYVDGLHFLVLEIDGTKTNTARRAVMEWIFDGDVNDEGITVKIMGKKERKVAVDK
ncbi:hypothetical protein Golax_023440, partial [Gossypium laxum]|nr:hypothetical protein [Gossypium laxum]